VFAQAPGSVIVLIATHVDKLPPDGGAVQQRLQDIMYSVKDAECRAVENIKSELQTLQSVSRVVLVLVMSDRVSVSSRVHLSEGTALYCIVTWLVAWYSGRMSVFDWRTFPVLRSTCS